MDKFNILNGDSFELLKQQPDNSFDSVVTDPPYGIGFMGKDWDKAENIAFNTEFWIEVLRVLKPGGHLLAFSASRTYHRMAVAIEDAGFEIRDQLMWLYGSGMPKSQNLGKLIEKRENKNNLTTKTSQGAGSTSNVGNYARGNQETNNLKSEYQEVIPTTENATKWNGWGTTLKPAHEPIVMARKPFKGALIDNVLTNGIGALNIDESRISVPVDEQESYAKDMRNVERKIVQERGGVQLFGKSGHKPMTEREVPSGRFPSNVIHDMSEEVINAFPNTKKGGKIEKPDYEINNNVYGKGWGNAKMTQGYGDSGSASRFFYGSKCSKSDRDEGLEEFGLKNTHSTVKPTDLMMYLIRLITPKGGRIIDPFNGSGSTGKAIAILNKSEEKDYSYVGMELDPDNEGHIEVSKARIEFALNNKTWVESKK